MFCLNFVLFKQMCLFFHLQLDDIRTGGKPDLRELKSAQGDLLDFLQLLGCSLQSDLLQKYQPQDEELFSAAHLLISAISGML